jgi:hypothetical protein
MLPILLSTIKLIVLTDHLHSARPTLIDWPLYRVSPVVRWRGQAASEEPAESFSTVDWVHQRLRRAQKQLLEPVHGWIVAHLPEDMVVDYHEFHHGAGFDCGRACQEIEYLWLRR